MAVTVTNSKILLMNTLTAVTSNAATADTDALAEVFTISPTRKDGKGLIVIGTTAPGTPDGNITVSIAAGAAWAGAAQSYTFTKQASGNIERMIEVDTGRFLSSAGTILVTLTPASTDKLKTDHAAYVKFYELI